MLKQLAFLVVVLAAFVCNEAVSQPPTPSSGDGEEHHETHAAEHHDYCQDNQRGTPNCPFVIQFQQSSNQYPIITEPKNESHWSTRPDWWIAGFTGFLSLVTFGLWIFTALQWRTTRRAVQQSAKGIDLANKTYIASHRPRIVIRGLFMVPPNPSSPNSARLSFIIANVGDTDAEVVNFKFFLLFRGDDDSVEMPIVRTEEAKQPSFKLVVGEEFRWYGNCEMNAAKFINATNRAVHDQETLSELEFRGTTSFKDWGGNLRHTSFHRSYDFKHRRFNRIENSEFEYQG